MVSMDDPQSGWRPSGSNSALLFFPAPMPTRGGGDGKPIKTHDAPILPVSSSSPVRSLATYQPRSWSPPVFQHVGIQSEKEENAVF
jgi:hypothetical protein